MLYATAYGSHVLYGLIGTGTASAAMLAVTAAALVLSLRHGAPTAVMGLVGGFLTPLLVGDPDAGAVPLLAYLALLDLALFAIAWRRGWTWLAAAAVLLSFVWTGYPAVPAAARTRSPRARSSSCSRSPPRCVRPGEGRQLEPDPAARHRRRPARAAGRAHRSRRRRPGRCSARSSAASLALARAAAANIASRRRWRSASPCCCCSPRRRPGRIRWSPRRRSASPCCSAAAALALALAARPAACGPASPRFGLAGPLLILRARPARAARPARLGRAAGRARARPGRCWSGPTAAAPRDEPPADLVLLLPRGAARPCSPAPRSGISRRPIWSPPAGWRSRSARRWRRGGSATSRSARVALLAAIVGGRARPVDGAELSDRDDDRPGRRAGARRRSAGRDDGALRARAAGRCCSPRLRLRAAAAAARRAPRRCRRSPACSPSPRPMSGSSRPSASPTGEDFVARGLIERTIITQALFAAGWLLGAGIVRPPRIEPDLARLAGTMLTALAAARLIWFDMLLFNPAWAEQWVGTLPVAQPDPARLSCSAPSGSMRRGGGRRRRPARASGSPPSSPP